MPPVADDECVDPESLLRGKKDALSHTLKRIFSLRMNAWACVKRNRNRIVFLTLTFEDQPEHQPDTLHAERSLRKATPLLDELFSEWMLVLEFDEKSGAPHYHGLAAARQNISSGYNFSAYRAKKDLRNQGKRRELTAEEKLQFSALGNHLRPNQHLQKLWKRLRTGLPEFGFAARSEASPLCDAKVAIPYLLKQQKIPTKKWPRYRRGTKLAHYSESFQIVCTKDFSWNTPKTSDARRRQTRIAHALGVDEERCKGLFGKKRWQLRLTKVIAKMNRLEPMWIGSGAEQIEELLREALVLLGEDWSKQLAEDLRERRNRINAGLPERPDPEPLYDIQEDLRHSRELQQSMLGERGEIRGVAEDLFGEAERSRKVHSATTSVSESCNIDPVHAVVGAAGGGGAAVADPHHRLGATLQPEEKGKSVQQPYKHNIQTTASKPPGRQSASKHGSEVPVLNPNGGNIREIEHATANLPLEASQVRALRPEEENHNPMRDMTSNQKDLITMMAAIVETKVSAPAGSPPSKQRSRKRGLGNLGAARNSLGNFSWRRALVTQAGPSRDAIRLGLELLVHAKSNSPEFIEALSGASDFLIDEIRKAQIKGEKGRKRNVRKRK